MSFVPHPPPKPLDRYATKARPTASQVQTTAGAGPDPAREMSAGITIHVKDAVRDEERDFVCDRDTLLGEMGYFTQLGENVDKMSISVHCDVKVFVWITRYLGKLKITRKVQGRYRELMGDKTADAALMAKLMTEEEREICEGPQLSTHIHSVEPLL